LGAPQLDFRVFDLRILEWYRNDPRYSYRVDDIHGSIRQKAGTVGASGRILLDSIDYLDFGFAYDDQLNRGIAVFWRYLHDLPARQQQLLNRLLLRGDYQLHPDYYRTQIIGDFPERVSIYDAFLEEKHQINEMCRLIGKPKLFRSSNKAYDRPDGFGILIRPTRKEFRDFALLLDQLLSDDINREFFKDDIPTAEALTKADGSAVMQHRGTIVLLETWIAANFRTGDQVAVDNLFKNIRKVRTARQAPAHKIDNNEFDQELVKQQRVLIGQGFDAVRTIRMILENHPLAKQHRVPDWLRNGRVWSL
jgi:hypothetical protein